MIILKHIKKMTTSLICSISSTIHFIFSIFFLFYSSPAHWISLLTAMLLGCSVIPQIIIFANESRIVVRFVLFTCSCYVIFVGSILLRSLTEFCSIFLILAAFAYGIVVPATLYNFLSTFIQ